MRVKEEWVDEGCAKTLSMKSNKNRADTILHIYHRYAPLDVEPWFRRKCLFVNLFELLVLLTGSFDNMFHHLGIRPRAWLESTFTQRRKRGQYLKATTKSLFDKHNNSQSVRATMVAVRVASSPIMASSPNDVTACMVLRLSPSAE